MKIVRIVMVGLGNIGRRFCEIMMLKEKMVRDQYCLELCLVGAADSAGAAYDPSGLKLKEVIDRKLAGGSIAEYPIAGRRGWRAVDLIATAKADLLLEASPVNLRDGAQPGLACIRKALKHGMHVVTPNKGPMVVAYHELVKLAKDHSVQLKFDGTVAGGLPALNLGQRDLRGAVVDRIEAVPNLVTGYILDLLSEGKHWDEALDSARQEGVLEANAEWDLEGWDAAAKLVILANAVLGIDAHLDDVVREGITDLDRSLLGNTRGQNGQYRLLAQATRRSEGAFRLSVRPVRLPSEHPLGRLGRKQMGVVFHTDIYGTITAIIKESDPMPSAATMLRDLLDIYSQ